MHASSHTARQRPRLALDLSLNLLMIEGGRSRDHDKNAFVLRISKLDHNNLTMQYVRIHKPGPARPGDALKIAPTGH